MRGGADFVISRLHIANIFCFCVIILKYPARNASLIFKTEQNKIIHVLRQQALLLNVTVRMHLLLIMYEPWRVQNMYATELLMISRRN